MILFDNMSIINDDFPDPDTPVTTVRQPRGILTLIFLRLFSSAPRIDIYSLGFFVTKFFRVIFFFPERYMPVSECLFLTISSYVPANITSPPWIPARGHMSIIYPLSCIISSSCSTTITLFPMFASRLRFLISISLSRGWSQIDGSSRT